MLEKEKKCGKRRWRCQPLSQSPPPGRSRGARLSQKYEACGWMFAGSSLLQIPTSSPVGMILVMSPLEVVSPPAVSRAAWHRPQQALTAGAGSCDLRMGSGSSWAAPLVGGGKIGALGLEFGQVGWA